MPSSSRRSIFTPVVSFFAELRRRRVLQMGGAYIAGAWLAAEVLGFLLEQFDAPDWTLRFLAIVFVVGFPLTMILAWLVQLQADGSWAFDSSRGHYRIVAIALAVGALATAGLSWLIVPEREVELPYVAFPNSLAVLPFADADRLYGSLIAGLEQSSELTLVRLEPNFETDDLQEFGRALGVSVLAIAQVDSSDDSTHIEMQLLNIVLDETSWSRSYDWKPSQTLDISWTIANDLLEEMGLTVMSREKFAGTDDMEAWELLLSGKEYASVLEVKSLDLAIANFQAAIDLDPDFVRGHIGLALAIHELLDISMLAGEEIQALEERAALAASVARNLDRNSADTMYLLGLGASNPQVRIQAFERAIELDPDHDPSYYRYALQMKQNGNLEEAEQLIKRAARLRPMSKRYREELADILELKGKPE